MKCDLILNITFKTGNNKDEELDLCDQLLRQHYNDKYISITVKHGEKLDKDTLISKIDPTDLAKLKEVSLAWTSNGRAKKEGVGLYVQTHGGGGTERLESYADNVSFLLLEGIRFRKINLSWCFSAGGESGDLPESFKDVNGYKFMLRLIAASGKEDESVNASFKMEACYFAAYAAMITYIEKVKESGENIKKKQNVYENRSNLPLRVEAPEQTQAFIEHIKNKPGLSYSDYEIERNKFIQLYRKKLIEDKNPEIIKVLQHTINAIKSVIMYRMTKICWKIKDGTPNAASISEWTDSDDIQQIHKAFAEIGNPEKRSVL